MQYTLFLTVYPKREYEMIKSPIHSRLIWFIFHYIFSSYTHTHTKHTFAWIYIVCDTLKVTYLENLHPVD